MLEAAIVAKGDRRRCVCCCAVTVGGCRRCPPLLVVTDESLPPGTEVNAVVVVVVVEVVAELPVGGVEAPPLARIIRDVTRPPEDGKLSQSIVRDVVDICWGDAAVAEVVTVDVPRYTYGDEETLSFCCCCLVALTAAACPFRSNRDQSMGGTSGAACCCCRCLDRFEGRDHNRCNPLSKDDNKPASLVISSPSAVLEGGITVSLAV